MQVEQVDSYLSALSLYSPFLILGLILFLLGFIGIYGGIFLKAGVSGLTGFTLLYEMTTYTLTISVSPVIFDGVTTEQSFTEANSFMVNVFDHSDFKYFIFIIPTTLNWINYIWIRYIEIKSIT